MQAFRARCETSLARMGYKGVVNIDWHHFLTAPCYFCGKNEPPEARAMHTVGQIEWRKGFSDPSNLMPCCNVCAKAKSGMGKTGFVRFCRWVALHRSVIDRPARLKTIVSACQSTKNARRPKGRRGKWPPDYSAYKCRHLKLGRLTRWAISKEQFIKIAAQPCHFCGVKPAVGLDRLVPKRLYRASNVVPCCHRCNTSKSDMTYRHFLDLCIKVALHHCSKRGAKSVRATKTSSRVTQGRK